MRLHLLVLVLITVATSASAATIKVGPNDAIQRISDAARIAADGDTVLVTAGVYRGDVAVWRQKRLKIRSIGGRSTLIADGRNAEGKAIWVIRNGDFHIEGFEFIGARAKSGNGAGIRFERGHLDISDCYFHDNQMGLLTGNHPDATLRIRNSAFADAPRQQSPLPHLLYVGRIARLDISGSRFENGYWGHLVKSRAQYSALRFNLISDGPYGEASYEVDFPNGGDVLLIGNVIAQAQSPQNLTLVAFGAEGLGWPRARIVLASNTLINQGDRPAQFVRTWVDKRPDSIQIEMLTRNNLLLGHGDFPTEEDETIAGNQKLSSESTITLRASSADALLKSMSTMQGRHPAVATSPALTPAAEFSLPAGTSRLPFNTRLVGALQNK